MHRKIGLSVLLAIFVWTIPAHAEQDKLVLVSIPDPTREQLPVMLTEDPRGLRMLRVHLPVGRNVGQIQERIRWEDVSAQAFNDAGLELIVHPVASTGVLPGVCNGVSCEALAHYRFEASNVALDRLRKVVVLFKGKRYEMNLKPFTPDAPKP